MYSLKWINWTMSSNTVPHRWLAGFIAGTKEYRRTIPGVSETIHYTTISSTSREFSSVYIVTFCLRQCNPLDFLQKWQINIFYDRSECFQMYNSNFKSGALYGSECWRVAESNVKNINTFHCWCLQKICPSFLARKFSNENLKTQTKKHKLSNVVLEIKHPAGL